mgnify:FL=1
MMDTYLIKIDDKYLVGTNEEDFGKVPVGGWYDTGGNIGGVILSTERRKAKIIEGNINLKSYFNRIYDATRYGTFKFDKLEIVRVENDR